MTFFPHTVTYRRVNLFTNRLFQFPRLLFKMAIAFQETSDMILTHDQAEHINFCHVEMNEQRASKFKRTFNLTATLAFANAENLGSGAGEQL